MRLLVVAGAFLCVSCASQQYRWINYTPGANFHADNATCIQLAFTTIPDASPRQSSQVVAIAGDRNTVEGGMTGFQRGWHDAQVNREAGERSRAREQLHLSCLQGRGWQLTPAR